MTCEQLWTRADTTAYFVDEDDIAYRLGRPGWEAEWGVKGYGLNFRYFTREGGERLLHFWTYDEQEGRVDAGIHIPAPVDD